ncbi:hypothetical protein HWV62_22564 [Athelia sp. TMB]|nr:hypothetical protein HWV62_22564 [Athelia sp. TMB]
MSTIYNHRSLQPTGPPASGPSAQHSHARLTDSFEAIRQEFDILSSDLGLLRGQRDEFENKITSQVNELNIIRQALYELETQHGKVRSHYEEELARLRAELQAARQNIPTSTPAPAHTPIGPGAPGPPPLNDPYYSRGREERDRERDREPRGDRERERDRMVDRDRDRERDRERGERDMGREKDRERSIDHRDPKRLKMDRDRERDSRMKIDRPDHFSPSLGPNNPKPPLAPGLPPPPPAHGPYPPSAPDRLPPAPLSTLGPSSSLPPAPPPQPSLPPMGAAGPGAGPSGELVDLPSFPDDLDPHSVPPEMKKDGSDWFAVFNPKTPRVLDVNLVHTLMHESVVCCVRFSADGKYLATGCNRAAQIYDTKTGSKVVVLVDKSASKTGDLYIRSVCFSPDGKYLATGAEDKKIRIWDIAAGTIRRVFDGHQQEIYSLDFSADGRLIVSGSGDKTARIWNMENSESKVLTIVDPDASDAGVTSVAISASGHLVAAGSLDAVVRIWDANTGNILERLRGHRDSVYSVAFTPDGKGLVSGSLDKTLKYWDMSGLVAAIKAGKNVPVQGKLEGNSPCTMNFTGHKDYVLSVAVSHDGQWVVSGSKDRGVQFWDSRTAIVQCMLQGHKNSVISIDLSPAGNVLATGSGDWQARIWSYHTI